MKNVIGGLGAILVSLTVLLFWLDGVLILYGVWGLIGGLIGLMIAPVGMIVGFCTIFATVWTFIGSIIWFGLLALMINYGETEC